MDFFENINKASEKLGDAGKAYVEKSQEYYKLKIFEQTSAYISLVTKIVVIGGLLFTGLIFLAFAFAIYLGNILDNPSLGYVITAAIILVMAVIVYWNRHRINNVVVRKLSSNFFED